MGDEKPEPDEGGGVSGAAIAELVGHVIVLRAYATPGFVAFTAGLSLLNEPARAIQVIAGEQQPIV